MCWHLSVGVNEIIFGLSQRNSSYCHFFLLFFHILRTHQNKIVMTTASQQIRVPTWREIVGSALLVEYELKFDVNFSQRKHLPIFYYRTISTHIHISVTAAVFFLPKLRVGERKFRDI